MVFVFRHKTCLRRLRLGVAAFVQFGGIRGSQTQRILGSQVSLQDFCIERELMLPVFCLDINQTAGVGFLTT